MRLVFLGSDPIALPLLEWLASRRSGEGAVEFAGVFTQPDRPAGRGQQVRANGIKAWALGHGLPVWQPERLDQTEEARLAGLQADLALVMAYGHILRESFLGLPRLGTLNLHASILPKYRGASPIQTAVACGERESGVTLMRIVRRLDAGPVADLERVPIGPLDTAAEVEARLARACVPLLARAWPKLARGELAFAEQDHAAATYCRKLEKEDGRLDWGAPAPALAARINGLFPWPGCAAEIAGQPVRLGLADALEGPPAAPAGTVLGADAEGLKVAAGTGAVRLRRLQRPGARMLPAAEFLRGFPVPAGTRLPSAPMTALTERR